MKSIVIFLSLMACLCCANALKCYVCNSLSDKGCDSEPVSKDYLIDCKDGRNNANFSNFFKPVPDAKVCWKQRQDVEGITIVDRMCGTEVESNGNTCYDRVGTKKIKVRYCVCASDKCNGSGSVAASSVAVVLGLLFTFLARP